MALGHGREQRPKTASGDRLLLPCGHSSVRPHLYFTGEPSMKCKFWDEITSDDKNMKNLEPFSPYCHPLGHEKISRSYINN